MEFFPSDTQVFIDPFVQFYYVKNDGNCKVAPELAVSKIILSEQQIKALTQPSEAHFCVS